MLQELKIALRGVRKSVGLSLAVIGMLGLAIGANTTVFSIVKVVLLRPLPYRNPDQLVQIWATEGGARTRISAADYLAVRSENKAIDQIVLYQTFEANFTGKCGTQSVIATRVSSSLFSTLDIQPLIGRAFLPEEEKLGNEHRVILAYRAWMEQFQGDNGIIGSSIILDKTLYVVVGVSPPGFSFPDKSTDLWLPLVTSGDDRAKDKLMIGRLRPGVDRRDAQAMMNVIAERLASSRAGGHVRGFIVVPMEDEASAEARPALRLVSVCVVLVLLLACLNVANLLIARGITRQKELATRIALGSSRPQIYRLLLFEGLVLAFAGGILGLAFSWASFRILGRYANAIPHVNDVRIDPGVLAFALGVSAFTGLLFGLLPGLRVTGKKLGTSSLVDCLRTNSVNTRLFGHRVGNLLAISEVSMALALLITSGVMIKSLWRLTNVDLGFRPERVVTMWISLPESDYKNADQIGRFFRRVVDDVGKSPGVEAVGVSNNGIFNGSMTVTLSTPLEFSGEIAQTDSVEFRSVNREFFRALGIPLLRGRLFDSEGGEKIGSEEAIVDETLASHFWHHENPIGKRITLTGWGDPKTGLEIVGVVGRTRDISASSNPVATVYVPYLTAPSGSMSVIVRAASDPRGIESIVREQVRKIDDYQAITGAESLHQVLDDDMAPPRFRTYILCAFAALALILALAGIYAVISFAVVMRTREIGIRLALGSSPRGVMLMILRHALRICLIGIALGLGIALALTRLVSGMLFGIQSIDATMYILVSAVFLTVALLASCIPAYRTTKVDPIAVLRYE